MNNTREVDTTMDVDYPEQGLIEDEFSEELAYSGSFVELTIEDRVRERTRQYLDAKREADIASVSKSVFLANMSHEIRTPLNAILGYAQILGREASLEDEQYKYLDSILQGARHLLSLVNGVLDISKIEAGHVEVLEQDFDLVALMKTVESMAQSFVSQTGIEFRYSKADDVPNFVRSDETKLRQIIVNLVSNAFKFTEAGAVSVSLKRASLPEDMLIVEVEDTGVGIPMEDLSEVFKPFHQTDRGDYQSTYEGTGLGLAISQEYARLLGGDISVSSELGRGTCFTLRFPCREASRSTDDFEESQVVIGLARPLDVIKILIVDDNADAAYLSSQLLGKIGFDVEVAHDGLEAVEMYHKIKPDLILMDRRMPRLDGLKATEMIRGSEGTHHSRIIMLSASVLEEDRERCLSSGIDSFIEKPYLEDDLLKEISRLTNVQYVYTNCGRGMREGRMNAPESQPLLQENDSVLQLKHGLLSGDQAVCLNLVQELDLEVEVTDWIKRLIAEYRYDEVLKYLESFIEPGVPAH